MERTIRRDKYLQKLINRIDNGMIKIITGLKGSGKSYLLNTIFYEWLLENGVKRSNIIKFAFDSASDLEKLGINYYKLKMEKEKVNPNKFIEYINKKTSSRGKYYLLLDEVQELESFEFVLNGFLYKNNFDVYVTGSNAKFLVSDIITEFRGRGDKVHVLPLSFSECWKYYNDNEYKALESYMLYGGLPLVVLSKNEEQRITYIKNEIEETYLANITERYGVRKNTELNELFNVLAFDIFGLTNPKKLSGAFNSRYTNKLDEETIAKYIKYFVDSFLVNISYRYDIKGKKYISTPYKIFFEDIGIRNIKNNFRQTEYNHIMKNVIFNELRYRGFDVDVGQVEIRENYKCENGYNKQLKYFSEVDFVANKGSKRYYIQSIYSIADIDILKQEQRPLINIGDSFKKIIVVYEPIVARQDENGILYIGLLEFLLDENSLEK